jgi:hypothetical protein
VTKASLCFSTNLFQDSISCCLDEISLFHSDKKITSSSPTAAMFFSRTPLRGNSTNATESGGIRNDLVRTRDDTDGLRLTADQRIQIRNEIERRNWTVNQSISLDQWLKLPMMACLWNIFRVLVQLHGLLEQQRDLDHLPDHVNVDLANQKVIENFIDEHFQNVEIKDFETTSFRTAAIASVSNIQGFAHVQYGRAIANKVNAYATKQRAMIKKFVVNQHRLPR